MPQIEILPLHTSHTRSQPGWAYVPDISSSALAPTAQQPGNRKRAARLDKPSSTAAAHSTSAKQQKAIEQHLKDLDKENYRDVHVPIPKRERDDGGKGAGAAVQQSKKLTSNVRRILGYNRAFAHYLADEEAAIAAGGGGFAGTWGQGLSTSSSGANAGGTGVGAGRRDDKRKSLSTMTEAKGGKGRAKRQSTANAEKVNKEETQDVEMVDADITAAAGNQNISSTAVESTSTPSASTQQPQPQPRPLPPRYDPALDADPLLRTLNLPQKPSDRVMAALCAEPPLSYAAARAKPLDEGKLLPRRHFCAMCGFWGKVKCRRCGRGRVG